MKFIPLLLATCYLLLFSCVPHEFEIPEPPSVPAKGKVDETAPKTLKDEVLQNLKKMELAFFLDSSIPVEEAWGNINYKGADYAAFFQRACPADAQKIIPGEFSCNYVRGDTIKKFKIAAGPADIAVDIEKLGGDGKYITAVWKISGAEKNFTAEKYEKIERGGLTVYRRAQTIFKQEFGIKKIAGKGQIGSHSSYSFITENIRYDVCANVPDGEMILYGENVATVFFYGETESCSPCSPASINNHYGKYDYCGPWGLQDIFDYLNPFTQN